MSTIETLRNFVTSVEANKPVTKSSVEELRTAVESDTTIPADELSKLHTAVETALKQQGIEEEARVKLLSLKERLHLRLAISEPGTETVFSKAQDATEDFLKRQYEYLASPGVSFTNKAKRATLIALGGYFIYKAARWVVSTVKDNPWVRYTGLAGIAAWAMGAFDWVRSDNAPDTNSTLHAPADGTDLMNVAAEFKLGASVSRIQIQQKSVVINGKSYGFELSNAGNLAVRAKYGTPSNLQVQRAVCKDGTIVIDGSLDYQPLFLGSPGKAEEKGLSFPAKDIEFLVREGAKGSKRIELTYITLKAI